MRLIKSIGKLAKTALITAPGEIFRQQNKQSRGVKRAGRDQMGAMNAERQAIIGERVSREGELTSQRNRLALGMAKARRNRGGMNFGGGGQPSSGIVKSTLG